MDSKTPRRSSRRLSGSEDMAHVSPRVTRSRSNVTSSKPAPPKIEPASTATSRARAIRSSPRPPSMSPVMTRPKRGRSRTPSSVVPESDGVWRDDVDVADSVPDAPALEPIKEAEDESKTVPSPRKPGGSDKENDVADVVVKVRASHAEKGGKREDGGGEEEEEETDEVEVVVVAPKPKTPLAVMRTPGSPVIKISTPVKSPASSPSSSRKGSPAKKRASNHQDTPFKKTQALEFLDDEAEASGGDEPGEEEESEDDDDEEDGVVKNSFLASGDDSSGDEEEEEGVAKDENSKGGVLDSDGEGSVRVKTMRRSKARRVASDSEDEVVDKAKRGAVTVSNKKETPDSDSDSSEEVSPAPKSKGPREGSRKLESDSDEEEEEEAQVRLLLPKSPLVVKAPREAVAVQEEDPAGGGDEDEDDDEDVAMVSFTKRYWESNAVGSDNSVEQAAPEAGGGGEEEGEKSKKRKLETVARSSIDGEKDSSGTRRDVDKNGNEDVAPSKPAPGKNADEREEEDGTRRAVKRESSLSLDAKPRKSFRSGDSRGSTAAELTVLAYKSGGRLTKDSDSGDESSTPATPPTKSSAVGRPDSCSPGSASDYEIDEALRRNVSFPGGRGSGMIVPSRVTSSSADKNRRGALSGAGCSVVVAAAESAADELKDDDVEPMEVDGAEAVPEEPVERSPKKRAAERTPKLTSTVSSGFGSSPTGTPERDGGGGRCAPAEPGAASSSSRSAAFLSARSVFARNSAPRAGGGGGGSVAARKSDVSPMTTSFVSAKSVFAASTTTPSPGKQVLDEESATSRPPVLSVGAEEDDDDFVRISDPEDDGELNLDDESSSSSPRVALEDGEEKQVDADGETSAVPKHVRADKGAAKSAGDAIGSASVGDGERVNFVSSDDDRDDGGMVKLDDDGNDTPKPLEEEPADVGEKAGQRSPLAAGGSRAPELPKPMNASHGGIRVEEEEEEEEEEDVVVVSDGAEDAAPRGEDVFPSVSGVAGAGIKDVPDRPSNFEPPGGSLPEARKPDSKKPGCRREAEKADDSYPYEGLQVCRINSKNILKACGPMIETEKWRVKEREKRVAAAEAALHAGELDELLDPDVDDDDGFSYKIGDGYGGDPWATGARKLRRFSFFSADLSRGASLAEPERGQERERERDGASAPAPAPIPVVKWDKVAVGRTELEPAEETEFFGALAELERREVAAEVAEAERKRELMVDAARQNADRIGEMVERQAKADMIRVLEIENRRLWTLARLNGEGWNARTARESSDVEDGPATGDVGPREGREEQCAGAAAGPGVEEEGGEQRQPSWNEDEDPDWESTVENRGFEQDEEQEPGTAGVTRRVTRQLLRASGQKGEGEEEEALMAGLDSDYEEPFCENFVPCSEDDSDDSGADQEVLNFYRAMNWTHKLRGATGSGKFAHEKQEEKKKKKKKKKQQQSLRQQPGMKRGNGGGSFGREHAYLAGTTAPASGNKGGKKKKTTNKKGSGPSAHFGNLVSSAESQNSQPCGDSVAEQSPRRPHKKRKRQDDGDAGQSEAGAHVVAAVGDAEEDGVLNKNNKKLKLTTQSSATADESHGGDVIDGEVTQYVAEPAENQTDSKTKKKKKKIREDAVNGGSEPVAKPVKPAPGDEDWTQQRLTVPKLDPARPGRGLYETYGIRIDFSGFVGAAEAKELEEKKKKKRKKEEEAGTAAADQEDVGEQPAPMGKKKKKKKREEEEEAGTAAADQEDVGEQPAPMGKKKKKKREEEPMSADEPDVVEQSATSKVKRKKLAHAQTLLSTAADVSDKRAKKIKMKQRQLAARAERLAEETTVKKKKKKQQQQEQKQEQELGKNGGEVDHIARLAALAARRFVSDDTVATREVVGHAGSKTKKKLSNGTETGNVDKEKEKRVRFSDGADVGWKTTTTTTTKKKKKKKMKSESE